VNYIKSKAQAARQTIQKRGFELEEKWRSDTWAENTRPSAIANSDRLKSAATFVDMRRVSLAMVYGQYGLQQHFTDRCDNQAKFDFRRCALMFLSGNGPPTSVDFFF